MSFLALLLAVIAVTIGLVEGRAKTGNATVGITVLGIMATSNLLACWPYFVAAEPGSWLHTYLTGLLGAGSISLLVHVGPFALAWYFGKRFLSRRAHAA